MTQEYTNDAARKRMGRGLCPECGQAPEDHYDRDTPALYVAVIAPCSLYQDGVRDLVEAYLKTREEDEPQHEDCQGHQGGCGSPSCLSCNPPEPCCYASYRTRGEQHDYDCENYR